MFALANRVRHQLLVGFEMPQFRRHYSKQMHEINGIIKYMDWLMSALSILDVYRLGWTLNA